ncbi:MAG TPA: penicillin-binding protein [Vicinamibacterales bacterium]|jgi:cell division protein FtsI (penicillin-binding protein 3)
MKTPASTNWHSSLLRRLSVVSVVLGLWVGGIEARLVFLQVFRHADLVARAGRQQERTQFLPAKRADILDRHGRVLAMSVDADTIIAVPSEIDNARTAVAKLCGAFGDCTDKERLTLTEKLGKSKQFAYVRRQIAPDVARRIADLNLGGIGSVKESKRFYPNRELAAHLLGYVGIDNRGLSGIESTYDSKIRGKVGTVIVQTDAKHQAYARFEQPPTTGSTVELTIDEYLQHVAERELHAGVLQNRAVGGTAIIMNPHTGEILAMANEPTFNPNAYREYEDEDRRNRAVQDLYEPGSTFKLVTVSAAIEEGVMPITFMIDTHPGILHIFGRPKPVTEASHHDYGVLSVADVIIHSSNIGAIKIGFKVGAERLSRFVERFGFGHPVSADFPSESPGIVWPVDKLNESALASVSMGYQVGVTALQMVTAVSSVANGGEMVQPHVVRAIYSDNRRYAVSPKVVRRTITPETVATLTEIMEGVVDRGTGRTAQIPGYTVAGKTGTAAKLVNGHYSTTDYNCSFVGFIPSRNPELAIIVVTDSPHAGLNTGGPVSGPVFKRIAEAALPYLGIGPTINPSAPVLVAAQNSVEPPTGGDSPRVSFVTDEPSGTVPNLEGLSAREAVRQLVTLGLNPRISGDGVVVSQNPPPGTPIEPDGLCRLVLERQPARHPVRATQP